MTTHQPLSLFISSKMQELADERRAIQAALEVYRMYCWIWEEDAGARPETIRSTYLHEVEACDIYLGLFWLGYGPYTIEEFEHARTHHKPCLIYEKHLQVEQRSPELAAFLNRLQQVDAPDSLTVSRFQTPQQLAFQVQRDVMRLLTTHFRQSRKQPAFPDVWNVPYRRNIFFTGREALLTQLYNQLTTTRATALTQALTGLGGIGKTQTAVEYAYRYRAAYQAILWVRATSRETLITDFVSLAGLLRLPEKDAQDQTITVTAAKHWLADHQGWLLIFDNADDLQLVADFLPTGDHGHILLTTRAHTAGSMAQSLDVAKMDLAEGTLLLLRRAKVLATDAQLEQTSQENRTTAQAIVQAMDGLPLALDQAGAYIDETRCTLSDYLAFYGTHRKALLQRRSMMPSEHPEPVATTWSLSFEQIEQQNPAADELLRFCAFLDADAIPEKIITAGASQLGPLLESLATDQFNLNEAIALLQRYSLMRRSAATKTLNIHRLVQAVLKDSMEEQMQHLWAERTVRAVNQAFPNVTDVSAWPQCERYLPHALTCAELIEHDGMELPAAAQLLNKTAYYLDEHALYKQAEPLYQRALSIREKQLGPEHPDTANSLNNLALLYQHQGDYAAAVSLLKHALSIREKRWGSEHSDTATVRENYAALLRSMQHKEKEQHKSP